MKTVSEQMIELLIGICSNEDVKNGLETALEIVHGEGYKFAAKSHMLACGSSQYNLTDWEDMTEEEKLEEAKKYL